MPRESVRGDVHAALASRPRRQVLDAIARSAHPVDALTIAAELGLHVTTVRFHLYQLETAHLVRRQVGAEPRRGRPRIRYVATSGPEEDSREQLIEVLAAALAERPDGRARSIEAGHRWADALAPPRPDAEPDSDADTGDASGVDTLVRVLDDLGFEPLVAGDDEIRLRACPFRDAARDHPQVVCSVHRGVIEQLLLTRGSDRRADLLPFVEPELCLVTLAAPGGRTLDE
ncbi:helix-turn-helix transcriptional regulator [Agromyces bauzanensis]|uniref:Transcriptional regulator n=1 Tax=Agromyces bauzanensis TaxID=1308924 RepID=A0A917UN44_9MICO|nr:helix-turn-helix domain-containing protein [Agromyces bauzanensis]GGJ69602.1 transcriptional regulator [Agromyces bauzanensis]